MKVFVLLCTFFACSVSNFAQNDLNNDLSRSLKRYDLIKLDSLTMEKKARAGQMISLRARGRNYDFELTPNDLRAPQYRAVETNSNGSYEMQPNQVNTFKGRLKDDFTSEVRFTVDGDTLEGMIYTGNTKLFVTRAREFSSRAKQNDVVVYEEGDVTKMVDLTDDISAQVENHMDSLYEPGTAFATVADLRQLEVATEADYQWVQQSGGNAPDANNSILSILNMVDGIYQRDLSLTISVTYQHAWTSTDPFSTSSMSGLLDTYVNYWNSNFPRAQYPRDTAHLFTGKFSNQGLAYIGVICRSPNSSYGITARSGGVNHLIAAHEIGHNLGADHVENSGICANSLMNPSLSGPVTKFCSTSIAAISSFVSQYGSCLTVTGPGPTPLPTPVPTPFPSLTPIPTPFPTPIPTPLPTPIPTPFPTPIPTPFPSPTPVPTPTAGARANYASASNGGFASSTSGVASAAIDGSRVWSIGGAWKDLTPFNYPDTLEVSFNGNRSIDEVNIFTVRDDYLNTVAPDLSTTTNLYPLSNISVQYWNGSVWNTIPGGNISGNNKVWTRLTFSPVAASRIRVVVNAAAPDGFSRIVELEAWGGGTGAPSPSPTPTAPPIPIPSPTPTNTPIPGPSPTPALHTNVALSANGGLATASSQSSAPSTAIDGVKSWAVTGAWKDSTPDIFPDWLQVDFNGSKTIDEVNVYGVRDDYLNSTEPTLSTVSSVYNNINFDVQYWTGSSWAIVPGGSISGNNLVVRKITFSPVTTSRIRVVIYNALQNYSRIVEVEAWSGGTGSPSPSPTPSASPTLTPAPTPVPTPTSRTNFARSNIGSSATASSELNPASAAIDGSRTWAIGGAWKDATPGIFPDWLQVDFNATRTIDEIGIYAVMDDYLSTVAPSASTTTSIYSLASFELQFWNGSGWSPVPNGNISGNNRAWNRLTFSPVTTSRIRVVVNAASQDGYSRIVEIEAWGGGS